jgi:NAD(P) transhydrogenase subunit alpha
VIISVPKESGAIETRVALTPDVVKRLVKQGHDVRIEHDAGAAASYTNDAFTEAGATIVSDASALWREADIVLMVGRPEGEIPATKDGAILVGMLFPLTNPDMVEKLARAKLTSFSLDQLPRISRAQVMDVLSSMSTIAGYKAVLMAAAEHGKFMPMLVTAAGTIAPAKLFVLGAGVAGLQAIATARRLGAVVSAFDVRPAVKEQVESLGAKFLVAEALESEGEGGYAKELSDEQHRREQELLHNHIKEMDVVITTALIPGRPAPELITEQMVKDMKPGSVIVDLAAETGGNCALTEKGETVVRHGVIIMGPLNIAAGTPVHASQMYAKNMFAFLSPMFDKEGNFNLDFEDEVVKGTCVTHEGSVVSETTQQAMEGVKAT